ncbi:phage holin family protein [Nocardioides alkalitolerans]|uniref:phage holin family protein n=1 Tax=Nocardioides alkalitolerans TaxID=281714 RepID=UPI00040D7196|nr:phage holin family protein [Nocardioides alkalitolerans]
MSAPVPPPTREPGGERSLGDIVGDVAQDLSTLVKQELDLAKVELKQEAAQAGKGAGMLGGAAVAGHLALVFVSLALVFLLDNWMPIELAALITTLLWAVVAAVLATLGRTALKKANPQLPQTQQTLKEDAPWARTQNS